MHTGNFDEALDQIVIQDRRFQRDAYIFVREALDHTQKRVEKSGKAEARSEYREAQVEEKIRHVTGQQLLAGIRDYALKEYGPMALSILNEWGVRRCEDFGEIVFNMVENHLLAKTKKDSREDFKSGYDFDEAFRRPFLPASKPAASTEEPKPTKA